MFPIGGNDGPPSIPANGGRPNMDPLKGSPVGPNGNPAKGSPMGPNGDPPKGSPMRVGREKNGASKGDLVKGVPAKNGSLSKAA